MNVRARETDSPEIKPKEKSLYDQFDSGRVHHLTRSGLIGKPPDLGSGHRAGSSPVSSTNKENKVLRSKEQKQMIISRRKGEDVRWRYLAEQFANECKGLRVNVLDIDPAELGLYGKDAEEFRSARRHTAVIDDCAILDGFVEDDKYESFKNCYWDIHFPSIQVGVPELKLYGVSGTYLRFVTGSTAS